MHSGNRYALLQVMHRLVTIIVAYRAAKCINGKRIPTLATSHLQFHSAFSAINRKDNDHRTNNPCWSLHQLFSIFCMIIFVFHTFVFVYDVLLSSTSSSFRRLKNKFLSCVVTLILREVNSQNQLMCSCGSSSQMLCGATFNSSLILGFGYWVYGIFPTWRPRRDRPSVWNLKSLGH